MVVSVLGNYFRACICDLSFIDSGKFLAHTSKCFFCFRPLFPILWDSRHTRCLPAQPLWQPWRRATQTALRERACHSPRRSALSCWLGVIGNHLTVHTAITLSLGSRVQDSPNGQSLLWSSLLGSPKLPGLQAMVLPGQILPPPPFLLHGSQICIVAPLSFPSPLG